MSDAGISLSLRDLTKRYGQHVAVRGVTLDVMAGEFLTILGPSGSGKSTTLMMVAGFTNPTAGDILLRGASILGLPPYKRNMGIVFQHFSLFPHMSAFDNVAFPLQMRNVPRRQIDRSVKEALELVRLEGLDARRPSQLSGGQQQRVALARALVFRPGLLLLDEPLGPLDLKLRQELQLEIKRIHESLRTTVLFVTHDQGEALSMSDRVVLMRDGTIHQVGTPQELYRRPATVFVARFIGESNIVTGKLVAQDGSRIALANEDGLIFRGVAADTAALGKDMTLLVRPESIVPDSHGSLQNHVEGAVEAVVYLGEITQYRIRIGPCTSLVVHWQNRSGLPQLRRSDRVSLGWLEEDMIAVSDA